MNTRKVLDIRLGNCIRAEAALPKTVVTPLCNFDHFSPGARAARATTVQVGTGHLSWKLLTCGSHASQTFVTPLCHFDHFSPCARAARATTVQVGTGHLSWQLLTCGSNTSQNFCNTAVATLLPQQKLLTAADVHLVG